MERIKALEGVLKVEGECNFTIEVELGTEERVCDALGAIEELRMPCGLVLVSRIVEPKRYRDFRSARTASRQVACYQAKAKATNDAS